MALREGETILDGEFFSLELYDLYRYTVTVGEEETVIPFDTTCHYLSVTRKGNKLTVSVSERKVEIEIPDGQIERLMMFSGPGAVLVDKLVYSRDHNVPPAAHYDKLTPSGDFNAIDENSYISWIFSDDTERGQVYSGQNSEMIQGYYITPLVGPHVPGSALRNLSEGSIEITYNGGEDWFRVSDLEKIPLAMESALIRSKSMNFEFTLKDFETENIRLPGVSARISGTVYPYHRGEYTFYTNATYDFSNASITITPLEDSEMPKSIWLYGKISPAFIDNIPITFLYRDGLFVDKDVISDTTNHLYLIGFEEDEEIVLNKDYDTFFGVNAIGTSNLDGSSPGQVKKVFDLFARNSVVSYAEEIPVLTEGKLSGINESFRVIDVQWTI